MEKIEFLSRYHNIKTRIEKKKEYIDFCEERSYAVNGMTFEERIGTNPNRNTDAPFVIWVYKKIEAEAEFSKLEKELAQAKAEIEEAISSIHVDELERVLVYRYIDWKKWEEVASLCYCSIATVYRWHRTALKLLEIKETTQVDDTSKDDSP